MMLIGADFPKGSVLVDGGAQVACPCCGTLFRPKKRTQRYCARACQKKATGNKARGSQKVAECLSTRYLAELHRGRAFLLNDALYCKPPADRPAFMETILRAARADDWHLRRILTDRRAILDFGDDYAGRPNLVRTLHDYCKRTRDGARLREVIAKPDDAVIRPLALYRDIWTDPDCGPDVPMAPYISINPAEFLATVRQLRAQAAG